MPKDGVKLCKQTGLKYLFVFYLFRPFAFVDLLSHQHICFILFPSLKSIMNSESITGTQMETQTQQISAV